MENVIILKDNKYTIIDSETAKSQNHQIVYSHRKYNHFTNIYLKNGLYVRHHNRQCKERELTYLSVYAEKHLIEEQFENSISDICYLANKYNTISMLNLIKHIAEETNKYADFRAKTKLKNSKEVILELAKQIQELKEITTKEFVNTNSKIRKRK